MRGSRIITAVGALMTDILYPYWKVPPMPAAHTASRSDLFGSCKQKNRPTNKRVSISSWTESCVPPCCQTYFYFSKPLIHYNPLTFGRLLSLVALARRGWYSFLYSFGMFYIFLKVLDSLRESRISEYPSRRSLHPTGNLKRMGGWVYDGDNTIDLLSESVLRVWGIG